MAEMIFYKDIRYLNKSDATQFDDVLEPGAPTPQSGIYRCVGSGKAVTCHIGQPLPARDNHHHNFLQGTIHWQLVVWG